MVNMVVFGVGQDRSVMCLLAFAMSWPLGLLALDIRSIVGGLFRSSPASAVRLKLRLSELREIGFHFHIDIEWYSPIHGYIVQVYWAPAISYGLIIFSVRAQSVSILIVETYGT